MDHLNCYICDESVPGYLNGLSDHFVQIHGLTISRSAGKDVFECRQGNCRRRYLHFYTLGRHIREHHSQRTAKSEEFIIPDQDFNIYPNDNDSELIDNQTNGPDDQENINIFFDDQENVDFDLRQHVLGIVEKFQCEGSVRGALLTEILDDFERLVLSMQNHFKTKVQMFLENRGLLEDDEAKLVLDAFDLENPFDELRSLNEHTNSLEDECDDVKPIVIASLDTLEQVLDRTFDEQPASAQHFVQPQPHCSEDTQVAENNALSRFSRFGTVTKTLENHPLGQSILLAATQSSFTEKDRKSLIRITVSELVKVYDSHYPPILAKIALAKAIVAEFPRLRNDCASQGYEHYYDENTKKGFIEFRLWSMRIKLNPEKKKYKVSTKKRPVFVTTVDFDIGDIEVEEMNKKIRFLRFKSPTEANKDAIIQGLNDTYLFRRHWILKTLPTVPQVFRKYPRLQDYHGEMIDVEFKKIHPQASDHFMTKFPTYYTPRILCYAKKVCPATFQASKMIENEQLRALLLLVEMLPICNALKKGQKRLLSESNEEDENLILKSDFPNKFLLRLVSGDINFDRLGKMLYHDSREINEPYLFLVNGQKQGPIFIKGNGWLQKISENTDLIRAFDVLYKCFHVFNINYPQSLLNFYNFIDAYVYKIPVPGRSVVSSLHINISNIIMDESNSSDQ